MDSTKNILNSSQFQTPLPLNPHRLLPQHNAQKKASAEEVMQSIKIKKNILLQALQLKKNGNKKEYFALINKQSFVNAKEEPKALRIWVKVFLDSLSIIIHEYQDHELLELIVFKLPWFIPTTTHGQNFDCFIQLVLAVLPNDVSYLHKVIQHIFSPHGLFQCIMLGEHRPVLADLLWNHAQKIIQNYQMTGTVSTTDASTNSRLADEQVLEVKKYLNEIKTPEDILVRAKAILKRYSDQNKSAITKVFNYVEQIFLKVIFTFHPTRVLPEDPNYPILIGNCHGFSTYFIKSFVLTDGAIPDEDDAISVKKCVNGIIQEQTNQLIEFAQKKFKTTALKKLGFFFSKLMKLYPFTHQTIIQSLVDKLPHKSMCVENQYLYYKMILEIAKICPESEEKILEAVVEKLCHLDVDIKNKIRKFSFSNMSKIQPMSSYLKEISVKVPNEKETKIGILFDLLLEYILQRTKEQVIQKNQNSFDDFIDSLMKIFEIKIFPIHKLNFMQYLPLFAITLSSQNEKCQIFAEKLLSFLIFKTFNCIQKEHLSVRQQSWNYLSSLISRQNSIIKEQTLMKCLQFIVKYYDMKIKPKTTDAAESFNSAATDISDIDLKVSTTSQEKIFQHCFIQGLALIIITKNDVIQQNDPEMFIQICKFVFKKHYKSLTYCSPLILADLLKLSESNKHGLGVFKNKLHDIFRHQNEELKSSKRLVYNKVSKYMAYECPINLYPCNERFIDSLHYEDISNVPVASNQEQQSQLTQTPKKQSVDPIYAIKHEEIDFPSSSQEEEKKIPQAQLQQQNSTVIYVPDINTVQMDKTMAQQHYLDDKMGDAVNLGEAIAQSRHANSLFNFGSSFKIEFGSKKGELHAQSSNQSLSKLSVTNLNELNAGSVVAQQSDDVISSGKDTEYSISPLINGRGGNPSYMDLQTEKALKKRSLERQRKNLTMNLKEENDRASTQKFHHHNQRYRAPLQ